MLERKGCSKGSRKGSGPLKVKQSRVDDGGDREGSREKARHRSESMEMKV